MLKTSPSLRSLRFLIQRVSVQILSTCQLVHEDCLAAASCLPCLVHLQAHSLLLVLCHICLQNIRNLVAEVELGNSNGHEGKFLSTSARHACAPCISGGLRRRVWVLCGVVYLVVRQCRRCCRRNIACRLRRPQVQQPYQSQHTAAYCPISLC